MMSYTGTFEGLVMDLGVSEGNDTAYYLAKGFRVIAVEADPHACQALRRRFPKEIKAGALILLNFAVGAKFGETISLFVHDKYQGVSGIQKRENLDGAYTEHTIPTIDWLTLVAQLGTPRYLKIDVEGSEEPFLQSMLSQPARPEFISVECYKFQSNKYLYDLGYRRFKLIDQNPPDGFQLPSQQMEGLTIQNADFTHASGPFGLDLFRDRQWLTFEELRNVWQAAETQFHRTWFDCHAWKPN